MKKSENITKWSCKERFPVIERTLKTILKCIWDRQSYSKIKTIHFICCLIFTLLFTGCISLYYAPNSHNVPMFKGKNETEASLAFQFGYFTSGINTDFAYSVTNHFGFMVNYNYWNANGHRSLADSVEFLDISGKSNLVELGAGYFLPFSNKFIFEAYGGVGWGRVKNEYDIWVDSKVNYNRYFIQPSFGYYNKKVELVFSTRLIGLACNRIEFDSKLSQTDIEDLNYITNNPFSLFLEPAFTFRVGGKHVKFQFQVVVSDNLNTPELMYDPLCINTGLIVFFPNKKGQKDKTVN